MAAIIQRLHLTVNNQLGLPNTFKFDSYTESENDSSDSDDEELSEGSSSRQPTKEGGTQEKLERTICVCSPDIACFCIQLTFLSFYMLLFTS